MAGKNRSGNYTFQPVHRLQQAGQFSAVFRQRRLVRGAKFDLLYRLNEGNSARLGLVIPKKLARRAVVRNAIRRVGREAFRHSRYGLAKMDLVLRLMKPVSVAGRVQRTDWRTEIVALLGRLPVPVMEPQK